VTVIIQARVILHQQQKLLLHPRLYFAMLPRASPGVNAGARGPIQTLGPGSARAGYCRLRAQQHDQGAFGWKKTQELRAADHAALGVCFMTPVQGQCLMETPAAADTIDRLGRLTLCGTQGGDCASLALQI
jgi:hypothetical protein